jgi:hypothetical protein
MTRVFGQHYQPFKEKKKPTLKALLNVFRKKVLFYSLFFNHFYFKFSQQYMLMQMLFYQYLDP